MTLPVVWMPEADADVKDARAWYDHIRPSLVSVSRYPSPSIHCNFLSSIGDGDVPEFDVFLTE